MYDTSDKSANAPKTSEPSFENTKEDRDNRLDKENKANSLVGDSDKVYKCLDESFKHIDLIVQGSGLSQIEAITALSELEMLGLVESTSGSRYKKS
jgi:predicted Rossmann fold nucleotide-binding protein DprA/Smf involved in DNA uptake